MNSYLPTCCDELSRIDFSKMALPDLPIRWSDSHLWLAVIWTLVAMLYWKLIAMWERRNRGLSRLLKSPAIAFTIYCSLGLSLSLYRTIVFSRAVASQPAWYFMRQNYILWSGYALVFFGLILIMLGFKKFGFFSLFYGENFNMAREVDRHKYLFKRVRHPVEYGTLMILSGYSIMRASVAGLFLVTVLGLCYKLSMMFEWSDSILPPTEEEEKKEQ